MQCLMNLRYNHAAPNAFTFAWKFHPSNTKLNSGYNPQPGCNSAAGLPATNEMKDR